LIEKKCRSAGRSKRSVHHLLAAGGGKNDCGEASQQYDDRAEPAIINTAFHWNKASAETMNATESESILQLRRGKVKNRAKSLPKTGKRPATLEKSVKNLLHASAAMA
jgi:hypothetical protein